MFLALNLCALVVVATAASALRINEVEGVALAVKLGLQNQALERKLMIPELIAKQAPEEAWEACQHAQRGFVKKFLGAPLKVRCCSRRTCKMQCKCLIQQVIQL